MPVWKTALLVLLLSFSGFALYQEATEALQKKYDDGEARTDKEATRALQKYDDGEAATDEPSMDDEPQERSFTRKQLQKLHAKMDADANGKLSLDEVVHFARENQKITDTKDIKLVFAGIDDDNDGRISRDEFTWSPYGGMKDDFKEADADKDDFLNETELVVHMHPELHEDTLQIKAQQTLEANDHDKDGFLTAKEFYAIFAGESTVDDDDQGLPMFEKLDKDGNGKLDIKEMLPWEAGHVHTDAPVQSFMQLADIDKDEHVSVEELHAAYEDEDGEAGYYLQELAQHHEL